MNMNIRPVQPTFVAEVSEGDLRRVLTCDEVVTIEAGMDQYAVLVFHDQNITDGQQLAFSRNFGAIEPAVGGHVMQDHERRLSVEFADVSNLNKDTRLLGRNDRNRLFNIANRLWHSDSSYRAVPAKYSILSGRAVPSQGGNTEFADMRAAYDALDEATKAEIEDLICEHSLIFSRGLLGFTEWTEAERITFAPVRQRLVRTHPVTGRKSLYLSSHAGGIVGWPVPEARAFLRDLTEHATQPQFVYAHQWQQYDLVMWDNRQTMHRVRRFKETEEIRDMRRTTIAGEEPTATQVV